MPTAAGLGAALFRYWLQLPSGSISIDMPSFVIGTVTVHDTMRALTSNGPRRVHAYAFLLAATLVFEFIDWRMGGGEVIQYVAFTVVCLILALAYEALMPLLFRIRKGLRK